MSLKRITLHRLQKNGGNLSRNKIAGTVFFFLNQRSALFYKKTKGDTHQTIFSTALVSNDHTPAHKVHSTADFSVDKKVVIESEKQKGGRVRYILDHKLTERFSYEESAGLDSRFLPNVLDADQLF